MPHIPHFDINRVSVRLRADGRFGYHDHTLSPQSFSYRFSYRILIKRKPRQETCEDWCMWWSPTMANFAPLPSSAFSDIGRFRGAQLETIDRLTMIARNRAYDLVHRYPDLNLRDLEFTGTNMRRGVMRLRYNSYTYREMVLDVSQTQRYYHETVAYCDYIDGHWTARFAQPGRTSSRVLTEVLGAWSTDPSVVQKLFLAGIPVYFVRPSALLSGKEQVVNTQMSPVQDESIITADWTESGHDVPFPARYIGAPSEAMHHALSEENRFTDIEQYFLGVDKASLAIPIGTRRLDESGSSKNRFPRNTPRNRKSKASGPKPQASGPKPPQGPPRDKWAELKSDLIPDTVPCWSIAHQLIDKDKRVDKLPSPSVTGYRFPDPGLVIFSERRRERNLFNWLLIRDATIRRAINDASSEGGIPMGISNELWRAYIGTDYMDSFAENASSVDKEVATTSSQAANLSRRQALVGIFGRPPDTRRITSVDWNGHTVKLGEFCAHDNLLIQEILWDLHQCSFQFDLIAIDRYLAPDYWMRDTPRRYELIGKVLGGDDPLTVQNRPTVDRGIAAQDPVESKLAYSALDTLMSNWSASETCDEANEADLATALRYCRTFSKTFGRPPILPKRIPRQNHRNGQLPYRRCSSIDKKTVKNDN
ncbi:hypothetical protein HWV62_14642 [Athelia sp. TMB]|nr:hypothetical protein HWV62_14642 [Athelia sp. TMB]